MVVLLISYILIINLSRQVYHSPIYVPIIGGESVLIGSIIDVYSGNNKYSKRLVKYDYFWGTINYIS